MIGVRPLLRIGALGLSLAVAACASADSLGIDTNDPNCGLLCALTRGLTGELAPPPEPASVPVPPVKPVAAETSRLSAPARPVRQASLTRSVRPTPLRPTVAPMPSPGPVDSSPAPPRPTVQALASPPPLTAAPANPAHPLPTLAQPIPGSVGIVPPSWQDH